MKRRSGLGDVPPRRRGRAQVWTAVEHDGGRGAAAVARLASPFRAPHEAGPLLKDAAFGRTRFTGEPVDRDFSDIALQLAHLAEEIAADVSTPAPVRNRVVRAAERLLTDEVAMSAAARELVASGQETNHRSAEPAVRR